MYSLVYASASATLASAGLEMYMYSMKVFMTGATGFIGSYVAQALLARGDSLVVLARNPQKMPLLVGNPRVRIVKGELTDLHLFGQALDGCDACVHIALGWGDTPLAMLQKDTLPTVALLEAAERAGCQQFLYTSSTAALGEMRDPMNEALRCIPTDLYGATKAASEAYVLGFRNSRMRRNCIRPGYTFGNPVVPGGVSQPDRRFADLARACMQGAPMHMIHHDGTQFIYASDLAKLFLAVLDSDCQSQVYLGLADTWVSWEEVARRMLAITGSSSRIVLEDRGWGAQPIRFEVAKIRTQFGLQFSSWPNLEEHIQWQLQEARRK